MEMWKKVILGILAFLFMLTLPTALIWYSLSSTLLNPDIYKSVVKSTIINSLDINSIDNNESKNMIIANINTTVDTTIDNLFNYINGNTDTLNLGTLGNEILGPDITQQMIKVKGFVKLAKIVGLVALILSIVFVIIAILLIRQIRAIMNWVGTYFLLGALPLLIVSATFIFKLNNIFQYTQIPQEAVAPITTLISGAFNNLVIFSGIFSLIGLLLLFIKFAFPKAKPSK